MIWLGPAHAEGNALFARALEAGVSPLRALALGHLASFQECWAFRRTIGAAARCCVKTVQRALNDGRALGLIGTARAKPGEIPPGCKGPLPCGWSHRWTIGWGKAGEAVKEAVAAARARWLVKHVADKPSLSARPKVPALVQDGGGVPVRAPARPEYQKRRWTAEELDAELERLERGQGPPAKQAP